MPRGASMRSRLRKGNLRPRRLPEHPFPPHRTKDRRARNRPHLRAGTPAAAAHATRLMLGAAPHLSGRSAHGGWGPSGHPGTERFGAPWPHRNEQRARLWVGGGRARLLPTGAQSRAKVRSSGAWGQGRPGASQAMNFGPVRRRCVVTTACLLRPRGEPSHQRRRSPAAPPWQRRFSLVISRGTPKGPPLDPQQASRGKSTHFSVLPGNRLDMAFQAVVEYATLEECRRSQPSLTPMQAPLLWSHFSSGTRSNSVHPGSKFSHDTPQLGWHERGRPEQFLGSGPRSEASFFSNSLSSQRTVHPPLSDRTCDEHQRGATKRRSLGEEQTPVVRQAAPWRPPPVASGLNSAEGDRP